MKNLSIKKLESLEEIKELITVFSLAFESPHNTTDEYLSSMLQNSSCVIFGALVEMRIVGGLVAFEMTPIYGIREFYIYDIAVHPKFQKQGLGKQLIEALKKEAYVRGVEVMFVEVESEDGGAVAFYRAIGGQEVSVNHFNFNI